MNAGREHLARTSIPESIVLKNAHLKKGHIFYDIRNLLIINKNVIANHDVFSKENKGLSYENDYYIGFDLYILEN